MCAPYVVSQDIVKGIPNLAMLFGINIPEKTNTKMNTTQTLQLAIEYSCKYYKDSQYILNMSLITPMQFLR